MVLVFERRAPPGKGALIISLRDEACREPHIAHMLALLAWLRLAELHRVTRRALCSIGRSNARIIAKLLCPVNPR